MQSAPFLKTHFARRILLLFLLCAMLPLVSLALLGYYRMSDDLAVAAESRLHTESKSAAMILLDRLGTLSSSLEFFVAQVGDRDIFPRTTIDSRATQVGPRFQAVVLIHADGTRHPVLGEVGDLPALLPGQAKHLSRGGVALVAGPGPNGVQVFLVRAVATMPGARVWGWIDPNSVWGLDPANSVAPDGSLMCLTDAVRGPLTCASPAALEGQRQNPDAASYQWLRGGEPFVAGQWTLFLKQLYAAPSWKISLSVPEESVFAPLHTLRRTLFMGLGLALAIVFALSHIQLRRSIRPLEALEAGTRRIAAGEFAEPVVVDSEDEFKVVAGSFNRMAGELERQFQNRAALEQIHRAALRADGVIPVLRSLFEGRNAVLPAAGLSVALVRPDDPFCWAVMHESSDESEIPPGDVRPEGWEVMELEASPQGLVVQRGERGRSYFPQPYEMLLRETLVLPLLRKGTLVGALVLPCRPDQECRPEVLTEARRGADQVAVAIANAQLLEQLDVMNWGALTALARVIDAASPWTAGHSERVTLGAMEIGRRLGLSVDDLELLHRGGLLHDIGKVGIPAAILDKPAKLTEEEYAIVKTHPSIGARILAPIGALRMALPLVLHHHEMLDGSGYPHGLAGDQIPLLVRILTVADVFDAMVSERPYRPASTSERVIKYLREGAGARFETSAVEALAAAVSSGWKAGADAAETGGGGRFGDWPERFSKPAFQVSL